MSAALTREPSRTARYLFIACAIAFAALVLGIYASLGEYFMNPRWYAYTIVALLSAAMLLLVGNIPRVMASIIILTLPMNICFSVYSRGSVYQSDTIFIVLNAFDVAAVILIFVVLLHKLAKQDGTLPPVYWGTTLPLFALIAVSGLSMTFAGDKTAALVDTISLLRCCLMYIAVLCFVTNESDITFILDLLVLLLMTSAVMYIIQATLGYSFDLVGRIEEGRASVSGVTRLKAVNAAGGTFACLCTLTFARLLGEKRTLWRAIEAFALTTGSIALIFTLSRGSWLAFGIGFCAVILLGATKKAVGMGPLITVIGIACIVLYVFGDMAVERVTTDDKGAAMSRWPLMKQALYMVAHNPVFGVGAGNYSSEMKQYVPEGMGRFWEWTVHNDFLLQWAECGTIGFAVLLWFLAMCLRTGFKILRIADARYSSLGLMLLGFMAAALVHMFIESHAMDREVGQVMSMLLALGAATPGIWGRARQEPPPERTVPGALTRAYRGAL